MRSLEPWVDGPLEDFLRESEADLVLLMTSSGKVIAHHGFGRSIDVMGCASLGAGIVATTTELARLLGAASAGNVVHQGAERRVLLGPVAMDAGRWIGLVVFDRHVTIGLVQTFFARFAEALQDASPRRQEEPALLAEAFEAELDASLRALFGR